MQAIGQFLASGKAAGPMGLVLAVALLGGCANGRLPALPAGAEAYKLAPAPLPDGPPKSSTIAASDELNIQVFQEPDLSNPKIQVDEAGNIQMPLIGEVAAAGHTASELSAEIATRLRRRYIANPQVVVSVTKTATQFVTVEGEVKKPGVYEIGRDYTLLSAIARAESPTRTARLDEILLFRTVDGQHLGARFDLRDIRSGRAPNPQVRDGDVVVVGHSKPKSAWQDFLQAAPLFNLFYLLK